MSRLAWPTRRTRARLAAPLALAIGTAALAGCTHHDPAEPDTKADAATPYPVALRIPHVPNELTIGVVLSLASPAGEGAEWKDAAQGAALAAWRLNQGGAAVKVTAVDDKGTAVGARAAVKTLAGDHAAAIVFATSGPHLDEAVAATADAGIPALLPYGWQQKSLPHGVWVTGPGYTQVQAATTAALNRINATHPVAVAAGQRPILDSASTITVTAGESTADLTAALQDHLRHGEADALLVSGDATEQAAVTAAFQGTGLRIPLVFTPDALSPAFPAGLSKDAASLDGNYWSVGAPSADATALTGTAAGQASAAFLAAVQQAAAGQNATTLLGDEPFATVAAKADAPSHDAVLAAVAAAAKAESTDPAKVSAALGELKLAGGDGLAGPQLDFTTSQALATDQVTVLRTTTQGAGLRPAAAEATLVWFTVQK